VECTPEKAAAAEDVLRNAGAVEVRRER